MPLKIILLLTLSVVLLGSCQSSHTPPDAMVLVENEHAFAAAVAEKGMRDGFLQFLADDGVLFIPGPVNGIEYYEASEPRPGLLTWEPSFAELSASGDMGWTTGPWEFRAETMADTPLVYGHYVTIWKLQPDSVWKLILDIGISHGPHQDSFGAPDLRMLTSVNGAIDSKAAWIALTAVETSLSAWLDSEGMKDKYLKHMDNETRLYRQAKYPIIGVEAVTTESRNTAGTVTLEPKLIQVSDCGTLGYSYGGGTVKDDSGERVCSFTHIWRKNSGGDWKLALDILVPN